MKPDFDLNAALETLPVNWNGHWLRGSLWTGRDKDLSRRLVGLTPLLGLGQSHETLFALTKAIHDKQPLDHWVPLGRWLPESFTCPYCELGDQLVLESNGTCLRAKDPCPNPDGIVSEAILKVPSGKMIIQDDLIDLCPSDIRRDPNRVWGCHLEFLAYAKISMIHGFVGNTCPGVYRKSDGTYVIGNFEAPPGVQVAGVTTDLWAYSVMDYEKARQRAIAFDIDFDQRLKETQVFDVAPGVYTFRHFYPVDRHAENVTFATFERVSP